MMKIKLIKIKKLFKVIELIDPCSQYNFTIFVEKMVHLIDEKYCTDSLLKKKPKKMMCTGLYIRNDVQRMRFEKM